MAKQRLFPEKVADDNRTPGERFDALASKVVTVPKSEIDARERKWRIDKAKRRTSR